MDELTPARKLLLGVRLLGLITSSKRARATETAITSTFGEAVAPAAVG